MLLPDVLSVGYVLPCFTLTTKQEARCETQRMRKKLCAKLLTHGTGGRTVKKTPDEIKKGLEITSNDCLMCACCITDCPYDLECHPGNEETNTNVPKAMLRDALAYIQQLEAQNDTIMQSFQRLKKVCVAQGTTIQQLEAERDAAVKDLHDALKLSNEIDVCQFCNRRDCTHDGICDIWEHERWEWRGVQKEE
jgi:hypothetical protein